MENLTASGTLGHPSACLPTNPLGKVAKRVIAGNPFYLISAGLLLYGINQLTTDSRLAGAEFSMLQFNFCALAIYELILVTTAILLSRRGVWYDALLLVGLANVFAIVPFSLISRALYLSSELALAMCIGGMLLAMAKFWAFKKCIPNLNLPGRLLAFGTALLILNAAAPLFFKALADDPAAAADWLKGIWLLALPSLAGLTNLLPRSREPVNSPAQQRWLPPAFYLVWTVVTACHLGGIGYSISFDWKFPLLLPIAWVVSWTVYLRRNDLISNPGRNAEEILLFIPLLLPLLGGSEGSISPILAFLNLVCYLGRFISRHRNRCALIQLLGATAILLSTLPIAWVNTTIPGVTRPEWLSACATLCFFCLVFLSRDPRVVILSTLALLGLCMVLAHGFSRLATQVGLVSILAHSLRWEDRLHKGAAPLRTLVALLWVFLSISWQEQSTNEASLHISICASLLLLGYSIHAIAHHVWKPWEIPTFGVAVLISEPGIRYARLLSQTSPGFFPIAASFLLFALGSLAAFSKSKGAQGQARAPMSCQPPSTG